MQDQIQIATPFWQLHFIFISFLIFPEVAGTLLTTDLNSPLQKCYRDCKEDNDCLLAVYFTLLHFSEPINSKPDEVDQVW